MPEPSRLVKLDQVHSIEVGTKIRFLGCIHAYDGQTARLTFRDRYPATAKDVPTAVVSVEHVLESLSHDLLETGAWLNIMGYLRPLPETESKPKRSKRKVQHLISYVEATMIWSAGAIKVDKYDAALTDLQQTASQVG